MTSSTPGDATGQSDGAGGDSAKTELSTQDIASASAEGQPSSGGGTKVETRPAPGSETDRTPLFPEDERENLRTSWTEIQAGFVDDPRRSVEQADHLVATAIKQLADLFAGERKQLESQWESGQDVSTEDLRVALQRYRSFFDRLLSA